MKVSKGRFSKSWGLRASVSFSPFPSPVTHFFALAPIFARLKNEKCLERAENLTETLATDELKFPSAHKQQIVSDILGGPKPTSDGCLYDCEDENEFVEKVARFKERWDEIERNTTRNDPPRFTQYFERHKEEKIRCHMTKYVREKADIQGVYGQNPIEWLHFMSKTEINDFMRNTGVTHRGAPLSAALDALKG